MKFVILSLLSISAAAHSILTEPVPRLGLDRPGTASKKYTHRQNGTNGQYPLSNAMLQTCGYMDDLGNKAPVKTYKVGDKVTFKWKLTLPHSAGGEPERIRLAIKYTNNDNFNNNILFSDTSGDASGSTANGQNSIITKRATVTLKKACNSCKLQYLWDSKTDGGGYIDCADIKILAANAPPVAAPPPTAKKTKQPTKASTTKQPTGNTGGGGPTAAASPTVGGAPTNGGLATCDEASARAAAAAACGTIDSAADQAAFCVASVSTVTCVDAIAAMRATCAANEQSLNTMNAQLADCGLTEESSAISTTAALALSPLFVSVCAIVLA